MERRWTKYYVTGNVTDHKIQTRGGVLHALMSFATAFDLKGQKGEREQNSVKCYITKKERGSCNVLHIVRQNSTNASEENQTALTLNCNDTRHTAEQNALLWHVQTWMHCLELLAHYRNRYIYVG